MPGSRIPNPADGSFATGAYGGAEYPAGPTFPDAGGTAIPRYPTNIYYNVATNAQEVDEYQTLYDLPTCTPIAGVTTCNPAGTPFTIAQIIASVDQGMFRHMMGNDPRPHYFDRTNVMNQPGQVARSKRCETTPRKGKCPGLRTVNLSPAFQNRLLHAGTRISVKITRPGWIGKSYTFAVRAARGPLIQVACLAPGAMRPTAGC